MEKPNADLFLAATKLVIDNFEGGYYHPFMFDNGRLNERNKYVMRNSGETLYGLDRHAGHGLYYTTPRISKDVRNDIPNKKLYKYKNTDSKNFWEYLDKSNAANLWKWNSQPPGKDADAMKTLASNIIYPSFLSNAKKYLSEKAQNVVFGYGPLLFHFIYATWNGPDFFRRWGKRLDEDLNKGINNPAALLDLQLNYRGTELSSTDLSAKRMRALIKTPEFTKALYQKKKFFLIPLLLITIGLTYYYNKNGLFKNS